MEKRREFKGVIKTSYLDSTPDWPQPEKAPEDAPNVMYILLDDTGFSQLGCYGSLIKTPCIDALAADGLRYNNFHVNAMCSPTRASLMTGCNNHTVGLGYLSDFNMGYPSLSGNIGRKYGYISEGLLEYGYSTFALGKWHLCNAGEMNPSGPFKQWPLGRGFEKYYGFLSAATSQFNPNLVRDNHYVDPPALPSEGYHLSSDLVDNAISLIGTQKSADPEKPFFCYLALGAMHGPHHAPKEYRDMYKGVFDEGWVVYREKVFNRQKEMGIIPPDTKLTTHNDMAPPWDSLTEKQKKLFPRFMEVFAGYMTYTDLQIGRLVEYLKKIGQYENTMIVLLSDNGASGEGGPNGSFNEYYHLQTMKWPELLTEEQWELLGTEDANSNYPPGWAWAGNTPLKWYKTWVHAGGVRVPLIINYPKLIKDKGAIRSQYHHVTDINATVYDILGVEHPDIINGVRQESKHGISMQYTFDAPEAQGHRMRQYYELLGNRGIWSEGWKAVANHVVSDSFDEDKWELYHSDVDFSESEDLAEKYPDKLRELIELWWYEAGKYGVLPMLESYYKKKDGFNFNAMLRLAPDAVKTKFVYYPEMSANMRAPRVANKSFTISVKLNHKDKADGILMSVGGMTGGYALYIEDGYAKIAYNNLSYEFFSCASEERLEAGEHILQFDFVRTPSRSGIGRFTIDGKPGKALRLDSFVSFGSAGGLSIGRYGTSPILREHKPFGYFRYGGCIDRVEVELDRPADVADILQELEQAELNQ